MRLMIRVFVLAAVSASATAAFSFDRVAVNVPFNFESDGKTFPAGTYEVETGANHNALTLSIQTDSNMSFTDRSPTEFGPNRPTLSLNFDIAADGAHGLAQHSAWHADHTGTGRK